MTTIQFELKMTPYSHTQSLHLTWEADRLWHLVQSTNQLKLNWTSLKLEGICKKSDAELSWSSQSKVLKRILVEPETDVLCLRQSWLSSVVEIKISESTWIVIKTLLILFHFFHFINNLHLKMFARQTRTLCLQYKLNIETRNAFVSVLQCWLVICHLLLKLLSCSLLSCIFCVFFSVSWNISVQQIFTFFALLFVLIECWQNGFHSMLNERMVVSVKSGLWSFKFSNSRGRFD